MTPLLLILALLVPPANQAAPDTSRYIILSGGNPAGKELAVRNPDGSLYFFEEYNDRGRGPTLETRITLTPAGMFQTLAITGHDYWKQPVDERFALHGDSAEWSSSLETGRRRLDAPALYSPFYGPVGSLPLLIGAARSSGEVSLLPTGRARVKKVGERTVSAGGQSANPSAGDQNPVYFQQTYDLRDIRIKDYAKRGEDISNSMPPGGQGLNRNDPVVARLMNQQRQMASSMGQFLGEEVLYVTRGMPW